MTHLPCPQAHGADHVVRPVDGRPPPKAGQATAWSACLKRERRTASLGYSMITSSQQCTDDVEV